MRRAILEWTCVAAVFAIAAFARYQLIQPPEVAQACELAGAPWWCEVRMLVIRSFANFGLGYAAMATTLLTVLTWNRVAAWLAAMVGAAGLILYCYEPAAVSFVIGVLVLARAQSGTRFTLSQIVHDR
jgi:hypothetical protein